MDPDSGRLPGEILDDVLGSSTRRAVLSGPSFADDLAAGLPAAVVVAADDPGVAEAAARGVSSWFISDLCRARTRSGFNSVVR